MDLQLATETKPAIVTVFMVFLATWQFFFNISNKALSTLIRFFYKFLSILANFIASERLKKLLNKFPSAYNNLLDSLGQTSIQMYIQCMCYVLSAI